MSDHMIIATMENSDFRELYCKNCKYKVTSFLKYPCRQCTKEENMMPTNFVHKNIQEEEKLQQPTDINYETTTEEEIGVGRPPKDFYEAPVYIKGIYETLGQDIGKLVDEKNLAYGDSVNTSAEAFKLLFPDGIKPEQYSDALLLVRIWDKMKRIATKKGAFDESPFKDIVRYGILGAKKDEGQ